MLYASPFRIFFISSALWAVLSIPLWILIINGKLPFDTLWHPQLWHPRSLLFGVLNPAIAGFLLTAVCVWTQTERLHGRPLILLWLVWFVGRLFGTFDLGLPGSFIITVDNLFLLLVIVDASKRVWQKRQTRQLAIMVPLALLWLYQIYFEISGHMNAFKSCLIITAALMLAVGARIVPAFTSNWLRQKRQLDLELDSPQPVQWTLGIVLLGLVILFSLDHTPGVATIAILAAALSLILILPWRFWLVLSEPLLWILHLSLLWLPISFVLLAGHHLFHWPATAWQHVLGIGAMGGLIMGVITRVSLGHSGRDLQLPKGITSAYLLIQLSVISRLLVLFQWLPWKMGVIFSGSCWVLAFALFVWSYAGILWQPRPDGRAG